MNLRQVADAALIGGSLLTFSTLLYGLNNLTNHPNMHYNGMIGNDHIVFSEDGWQNISTLRVEKPNGEVIEYKFLELFPNVLKLDRHVVIRNGGIEERLDRAAPNADSDPRIRQAMAELTDYVNAIAKANNAEDSVSWRGLK